MMVNYYSPLSYLLLIRLCSLVREANKVLLPKYCGKKERAHNNQSKNKLIISQPFRFYVSLCKIKIKIDKVNKSRKK